MAITDLIGFILPPVIDLVNQHIASVKGKYLMALLISFIVGVIVNLPRINLATPSDILASVTLVATEAQAAYKLYYENSQLRTKLLGQ